MPVMRVESEAFMVYRIESIKRKRIRMGLSINLLAHLMGVSINYLSRLEKGETAPVKEQLEVIDDFLEGNL